jgi:hypothetical protein
MATLRDDEDTKIILAEAGLTNLRPQNWFEEEPQYAPAAVPVAAAAVAAVGAAAAAPNGNGAHEPARPSPAPQAPPPVMPAAAPVRRGEPIKITPRL